MKNLRYNFSPTKDAYSLGCRDTIQGKNLPLLGRLYSRVVPNIKEKLSLSSLLIVYDRLRLFPKRDRDRILPNIHSKWEIVVWMWLLWNGRHKLPSQQQQERKS